MRAAATARTKNGELLTFRRLDEVHAHRISHLTEYSVEIQRDGVPVLLLPKNEVRKTLEALNELVIDQ